MIYKYTQINIVICKILAFTASKTVHKTLNSKNERKKPFHGMVVPFHDGEHHPCWSLAWSQLLIAPPPPPTTEPVFSSTQHLHIQTTLTHPLPLDRGTCKGWNRRKHECLASPGTCFLSTEPCVQTWVRPVWFGGHQGRSQGGPPYPPFHISSVIPIYTQDHTPPCGGQGLALQPSFQYRTAMLEHNDWLKYHNFD